MDFGKEELTKPKLEAGVDRDERAGSKVAAVHRGAPAHRAFQQQLTQLLQPREGPQIAESGPHRPSAAVLLQLRPGPVLHSLGPAATYLCPS